jgi:hypothetical protein
MEMWRAQRTPFSLPQELLFPEAENRFDRHGLDLSTLGRAEAENMMLPRPLSGQVVEA